MKSLLKCDNAEKLYFCVCVILECPLTYSDYCEPKVWNPVLFDHVSKIPCTWYKNKNQNKRNKAKAVCLSVTRVILTNSEYFRGLTENVQHFLILLITTPIVSQHLVSCSSYVNVQETCWRRSK